jgi:protein SCO1/2
MVRHLLDLSLAVALGFMAALGAYAGDPEAGRKESLPGELEGVELIEHLGAQIPLGLEFADETGRTVRLGAYFNQGRPVLMVLMYFRCPMICGPLLNGMVEAMKAVSLTTGKDYECVIVSFDPLEGPALAARKKQSLLEAYARVDAGAGVHVLTGRKENSAALAAAIGFGYKWVERDRMYAHPASLYVCSPAGKLSRYLKGVVFEPQLLRLSLVEAGEGRIGTWTDDVAMICFQYDPAKGSYSLSAVRLMRVAGVFSLVAMGVALLVFRGIRRRRLAGKEAGRA